MYILAVFSLFVLSVSAEKDPNAPSECLSKCLTPLAKLQRSFSYVFNNFEKVCDLLEDGAFCSRKCNQEDQTKFYQYTTFYRIHCIDYEEDIQEHLTCIAKASEDADLVCKDKCKQAHKVEKTASKETKMKKECLTLECSTLCYFDELAESCPEARNVLLVRYLRNLQLQSIFFYKINIGQVHSMASGVHPITMEKMLPECRNLHNTEYMRAKLLASSSSLLMDHTPSEMETEEKPVITA
ncbi:hypothetical protein GCK72_017705 [Caenorhabditis remanei]|uniref:Chondroitin proteoglycan 4 domain-containing protein n=1 Tax=Caenorhabditis remanei TaxID=31234 RepID=A0A6A5G8P9_CAERE|nr:hypothetical protein GCK72_017705 [Caenorhabditis remanei]KAF1751151.1 hypothetical protein GCK72_017705 [Caenorhabditis remanei]